MFVYFVKTKAHPQMLKIGKANDVVMRIAQLQTGCPYQLQLIGMLKCKSEMHARTIEQTAHRVFQRARKRGEWFEYSRHVHLAVMAVLESPIENLREAARNAFNKSRDESRAKRPARYAESLAIEGLVSMDREFRGIVQ